MPSVSRSDCTQVDLTETVKVTYDPDDAETPFTSKITHVDVDFNACQGINNRNNDLWAYMARLYYQGDVTPQQFGEAGRIITDNGCHEATKFQLNSIGMSVGYHHDAATWTKVAGRDALRDRDHHGRRAFAATLAADPDAGHHGLVYRVCATCRGTHQKIHYRRRTPVPAGFDLLDNLLYRNHNGGGNNVWGQDFSLHSTHEDAVADANPWECPNDRCVRRVGRRGLRLVRLDSVQFRGRLTALLLPPLRPVMTTTTTSTVGARPTARGYPPSAAASTMATTRRTWPTSPTRPRRAASRRCPPSPSRDVNTPAASPSATPSTAPST